MTFAELLASVQGRDYPLLDDVVRESRARQQAIEQRALRVREVLPMSPETARRVALFSLGGWAQNLPDSPHDLGERAALYIAKQLIVRNVSETSDMRDAFREWRAHELAEWFEVSRERQRVSAADVVRALAAMVKEAAMSAPRVVNRLARRAAASRRSK